MIKRILDIVLSLAALLLFAPLMMIVGLIIAIKIGRPILFFQHRPGLNESPFVMVKFCTMKDIRDANGQPLPDGERITGFGKFLRSTSIDELPELWNVLKGDMSLVGPRPLLMEYIPLYSAEQRRRHEVRPGITGWAQVNGRNALNWEDKFALDVWYVDNRSIWLDMRILWLTIKKVLLRDGISAEGEATMKKFTGQKSAEPE